MMGRPWFAVSWYLTWGSAASAAALSVLHSVLLRIDDPSVVVSLGTDLFRAIGPTLFLGLLSVATAVLLWKQHRLGAVAAIVAGGGILVVTLHTLYALLAGGNLNFALGMFFPFGCTLLALWQVARRRPTSRASRTRGPAS